MHLSEILYLLISSSVLSTARILTRPVCSNGRSYLTSRLQLTLKNMYIDRGSYISKNCRVGNSKRLSLHKSRELPGKKTGRINFIRILETNQKFVATRQTFFFF